MSIEQNQNSGNTPILVVVAVIGSLVVIVGFLLLIKCVRRNDIYFINFYNSKKDAMKD